MKTLFAILATIILAGSITYADDSWPSGNQTGNFGTSIFCTPTLLPFDRTGQQGPWSYSLGVYFNDAHRNPVIPPTYNFTHWWTLKGPHQASYILTNSISADPAGILLEVEWGGLWSGSLTGTQLGVNCSSGRVIRIDPRWITIQPTVVPGMYTWLVTISVAAAVI